MATLDCSDRMTALVLVATLLLVGHLIHSVTALRRDRLNSSDRVLFCICTLS